MEVNNVLDFLKIKVELRLTSDKKNNYDQLDWLLKRFLINETFYAILQPVHKMQQFRIKKSTDLQKNENFEKDNRPEIV